LFKKSKYSGTLMLLLLSVAVLLLSVGCPPAQPTPTPTPTPEENNEVNNEAVETSSVTMTEFAFEPSVIRVQTGTEVTWTNEGDTAHTVVNTATEQYEEGELFNSGMIQSNQTYSHTFEEAGEYPYYCDLHPQMRGRVIVED
jgi:amicyanin